MIIEKALNGYIVTDAEGQKMIYRRMDDLLKEQFAIMVDCVDSCGKIEVELNIIEIDAEETDELVEE